MATFTAHYNSTMTTPSYRSPFGAAPADSTAATDDEPHNNPHALPTPADLSALYGLVRDQLTTLSADAPTGANRELLEALARSLDDDIVRPPREMRGVRQEFLDTLERVPRRRFQNTDDRCPICCDEFRARDYPLVVELPCHPAHRFELECVGPWLLTMGNCPLCKKHFGEKKKPPKVVPPPGAGGEGEEEEEEEFDDGGMFG